MQKIKNIEFLRVIGCIAIILLHLFGKARLHKLFSDIQLYDNFFNMTCNGQKAVDLFFILSGFFFILKFDPTKNLWEFLKNKLIRLYPVLIFITIVCFIASMFGAMDFTLYDNILALLCLNGTSLVTKHGNTGIFWYVSAMLWVLVFYFYLVKSYAKKNVNLIIGLIVIFCYSFIIHAKGGKINHNTQTFYYIFNVGMMRALAGIGVGYFIGEWYKNNKEKIKTFTLPLFNKLLVTGLEFLCLFFIINNLMLHKIKYRNDVIYIAAFTGIIVLFLMRKGFISQILENDIWVKLSKYTYSLYLTHIILMNILMGSLWKYHPELVYAHPILNVICTLILIFIFGIFTYHLVEKPCTMYFKRLQNKNYT